MKVLFVCFGNICRSPFAEAASNSQTLLDASRRRLLLWGITPQQIKALQERGTPQTAAQTEYEASNDRRGEGDGQRRRHDRGAVR